MLHSKFSHPPIYGESVRIRLLEEDDIENIRNWRNQEQVRMWFRDSRAIQPEQQRLWYEKYKSKLDDYLYIVEANSPEWKPVGQIGLNRIDLQRNFAEYGRMIVNEQALSGKGFIYEASKLMFDYWYETYGIKTFYAEIKVENQRSLRLCSLLGFVLKEQIDGYVNVELSLGK